MHGARLTRQDRAMKGESETATAGEVRAHAILFRARDLICRAHDPSGPRDSGTREIIRCA